MTTIDYEKKYKDALEKARDVYTYYCDDREQLRKIESIFPELKESEDERVMKWCISHFKECINVIKDNDEYKEYLNNKVIPWLEKAMADAGYTFDFDKKELKTIVTHKFEVGDVMRTLQEAADNITSGLPVVVSIDDKYYHCNNELISIKDQDKYEYPPMNRKQKPAEWSEEDIMRIDNLVAIIENRGYPDYVDYLKKLKNRILPQPKQEWSEEDEQYLLICKNALAKYQVSDKWDAVIISQWLESRLKSLRHQSHWKPSERQKEALLWCVVHLGGADKQTLGELLEELNKL